MKIHVPIINKYSLCIFRQANVSFASRLTEAISYIYTLIILQDCLQVSGKGGAGEGLVGGLVFLGTDPGFQVIGDVLKKFHRAKRGTNIFVVFCVKNQDFMQKILFFPILVGGCTNPLLLESATDSGSDNNSMQMLLSENIVLRLAQIIYKGSTFVENLA